MASLKSKNTKLKTKKKTNKKLRYQVKKTKVVLKHKLQNRPTLAKRFDICSPYNIYIIFRSRSTYLFRVKSSIKENKTQGCVYYIRSTCGRECKKEKMLPLEIKVGGTLKSHSQRTDDQVRHS